MKYMERIVMIGRGAVGNAFAPFFQKARSDDFFFLVSDERKKRYEQEGFLLNGKPVKYTYMSKNPDEKPADLILITTKMSGLEEAMDLMEDFVGEDTLILSGINGILSEDILRQRFGRRKVLRAVAQKMDARYAGNEVIYSTPGELVFGPEDEADIENALKVKAFFDEIGFPYVYSDNIVRDAWSKLMLNCALNQTCAAYSATYGDVITNPTLKKLFLSGMQEVQKVAKAYGIVLEDELLDDWVQAVKALDPNSMPSMAQDVLARRKTEKMLFSGTVVPMAREKGIATPVLEKLYELVSEKEDQYCDSKPDTDLMLNTGL